MPAETALWSSSSFLLQCLAAVRTTEARSPGAARTIEAWKRSQPRPREPRQTSHRRHLVEYRQRRIEAIPGVTAHAVRHHLRLVSAWIVKACGMHGEQIRHGRKRQIYRRSASGAEAARLHIAAIANDVPMLRLALEFHALLAREGQIGSVPGAALALTVATLAVVHHHRLARDFITDRAAGASAGVGLTHVFSPSILPAGDGADVLDKFLPSFAHGLEGRIVVRRDEISFSQGAEWNALISKYIGTIPLSGDASYAAEHSTSGGPPPRTPVSSAMIAKVGAGARHSQSAARVAVLW